MKSKHKFQFELMGWRAGGYLSFLNEPLARQNTLNLCNECKWDKVQSANVWSASMTAANLIEKDKVEVFLKLRLLLVSDSEVIQNIMEFILTWKTWLSFELCALWPSRDGNESMGSASTSIFPLFQNDIMDCLSNATEMANSPIWLVDQIDPKANKLCQRQESRTCHNYKVSNACLRLEKLQKRNASKTDNEHVFGIGAWKFCTKFLNELLVSFFCNQFRPIECLNALMQTSANWDKFNAVQKCR